MFAAKYVDRSRGKGKKARSTHNRSCERAQKKFFWSSCLRKIGLEQHNLEMEQQYRMPCPGKKMEIVDVVDTDVNIEDLELD